MKRLRWPFAALAAAALTTVVWLKRSPKTLSGDRLGGAPGARLKGSGSKAAGAAGSGAVESDPVRERRAQSDPTALRALTGAAIARVGFDLDKLTKLESPSLEPLTQYLNYIKVQRAGTESLIFVRLKDLDELARLAGQGREELTRHLHRLGILLSMN